MLDFPLPVLGFCAWSGTGKTTLIAKLIPLLKSKGLHIGMVKHAHHGFEIDYPGKDSYILRKAGSEQMVIASRERIVSIQETPIHQEEPCLTEALATIQPDHLDLILVEGFKTEKMPKIELHRQALNRPYLYPKDPTIIALAEDSTPHPHTTEHHIKKLDLNQPEQIARFIRHWLQESVSAI
ncbi:MAG TPA: molybdopterin-guanine dinucleotide biosynthesis protein B [Gammaproteobacteria bacterium]|nr:molybdopterin-guanine dinucleotide biosynthesis protein B [Gammaproteobacteria bacterium]